ncbi:hypothetical protein L2E82_50408 [Cichorium intybus]|nr:hypothetical protein L2E82_50408 [Cichorium intybus]
MVAPRFTSSFSSRPPVGSLASAIFHLAPFSSKELGLPSSVSLQNHMKSKNTSYKVHVKRVQEHWGETVIPFSCSLEMNLGDLADDEAAKYCEVNKIQSALPKIIRTGFSTINLIYFFTADLMSEIMNTCLATQL